MPLDDMALVIYAAAACAAVPFVFAGLIGAVVGWLSDLLLREWFHEKDG